MVGGKGRGALLAMLMVSVALAGCLNGGNNTTNGTSLPDLGLLGLGGNDTEEDTFELPECHLVAGDITWPAVAGAPAPTEPMSVTLKTDGYGVTHVYADDLYSLWYGNGYAQARDRLFQMDVLRQVGYGTSAEYLGPGQLDLDASIHREMYTREELQAQLDAAPEEGKQVLQAYADGVNRWMAEAAARDEWPAEFAALGRVPPEWTPLDSVANINYLIGFFGISGGYELNNLQRAAQLQETLGVHQGWDALEDWVGLRVTDSYTSIHPDDLVLNGCEDPLPLDAVQAQLRTAPDARRTQTFGQPELQSGPDQGVGAAAAPHSSHHAALRDVDHGIMDGFKWGSNALVVDGSLTDTGSPIMFGAPQTGYYKPPVLYQIGLHAPSAGFDAVGIGVAGAPGIVIGRNADIAWTATSGIEDLVDLVELPLTAPRSYTWDGVEKDMECWTVEHTVRTTATNQNPTTTYEQEVCRAEGWPVVAINDEAGVAYMQKTTTRNEELLGALIWLQAPTMHSIDAFRELMGDFPFTFNYLVASHEGVAHIHTGDVPLRAPGYDPRLPTPAGSAYEWLGEAYTAEMQTWVTDPSRGYIANWNNAPVKGWRSGDEYGLWGPVQRVQMLDHAVQKELQADGTLSMDDVQAINWAAATHDSYALPFMPYLIDAAATDPALQDMHDALVDWYEADAPWRDDDGDGRYDDPAHAIWDAMMQQMFDQIMGDELGDLTPEMDLEPAVSDSSSDHGTLNNLMGPLFAALQGTTKHDWCDFVGTPRVETCQEQLLDGLRETQTALQSEYGSADVATWLHPVHTNKFLPFGGFSGDERPMVNRGSWVQVVSMAESERAISVMPPSNNGLITTAELAIASGGGGEPQRLTAELDLYWNNEYKPFPLTAAEVDAQTVTTEELTVLPF